MSDRAVQVADRVVAVRDTGQAAPSGALARIVGTGDVTSTIRAIERVAQDVVDLARERGFVHRFGESGEWFASPTWSLIAATFGVVAVTEWTRRLDGGWEARAAARTFDGHMIAAAEAMALRAEPGKQRMSEHSLRATAQTRAQRNALRSALGWALVMAGWDLAVPEAPATRKQVVALHARATELGWAPAERHVRAGVESFNDLTREQAGELLEAWSEDSDNELATVAEATAPEAGTAPVETAPALDLDELWSLAVERFGSKVAVLRAVFEKFQPPDGVTLDRVTAEQLQQLLADGSEA